MKKKNELRLSEKDSEKLAYAKKLIAKYLSRKYTVPQLAVMLGINRTTLAFGFKKIYGLSIHAYVVRLRMERAKQLLLGTNKPLKDIAQQCGYKSKENFITAFKKNTGVTPYQFRLKKR